MTTSHAASIHAESTFNLFIGWKLSDFLFCQPRQNNSGKSNSFALNVRVERSYHRSYSWNWCLLSLIWCYLTLELDLLQQLFCELEKMKIRTSDKHSFKTNEN